MGRAEVTKWVVRVAVGLIVAAPLAWLVYQRPEQGYGRWGEAGLYLLAAATAAAALLLAEVGVAVVLGSPGPQRRLSPDSFEEYLGAEIALARRAHSPVSLLLLELDAGSSPEEEVPPTEEELEEALEAVQRCVHHRDRAMRVSSNCLAVLMPKTDARGALIGADRLQRHLRDHFSEKNRRLTVRIGIGGRDPDETEAFELFARATQALSVARTRIDRSPATSPSCTSDPLGSAPVMYRGPVLEDSHHVRDH